MDDFIKDFGRIRKSTVLIITKNNINGHRCYHDRLDVSTLNMSENQLTLFVESFERAGFSVQIKSGTYFGIYDPSRFWDIVAIFPSNKQLLERELNKKSFPKLSFKERVELLFGFKRVMIKKNKLKLFKK